jgi:hypothetical protein
MEGNAIGPVPRRRTMESRNVTLRPAQIDAINYVAGENQYDSFAKGLRHIVDSYFAARFDGGTLPEDVATKVGDDLAANAPK